MEEILNFTENVTEFMDEWKLSEKHRFRSYDYCKKLFDQYYADKTLKNLPLSDEDKDYFALNLYCYLASWGMVCRDSLLMNRSYKFLIPICDILFQNKYAKLLDANPLNGNYDDVLIMDLYNMIYNKLNSDESNCKLKKKNVTTLLVCKIIMGTYGCVIAYDTLDLDGLRALGIKVSVGAVLTEEVLNKTAQIIIDHKQEFAEAMATANSYGVNYTACKVLDMILWIYGRRNAQAKK